MILLDAWQQTPFFEPDNPGQQIQEHYTGLPGGYSSFYWNRMPNRVETLDGFDGGGFGDSSTTSGLTLIAVMGLAALGLYAYNKAHDLKRRKK